MGWKKWVGIGCGAVLAGVLAVAGVVVWFVMSHRAIHAHGAPIGRLALGPDGRTLVSWGRDGRLRVWELPSGEHLKTLLVPKDRDSESEVTSLALSPVGHLAAVGMELPGYEGGWKVGLVVFDYGTGQELHRMEVDHTVGALAFSPDGKRLAVGFTGGPLRLYDTATWEFVERCGDRDMTTDALAFLPDGERLLVAYGKHGTGQGVRLLRLETDELLWDYSAGHIPHSLSLDGSASRVAVAVGSEDETSRPTGWTQGNEIWSGTEVNWYPGTEGSRNTVLLFDAETGALEQELEGHRNWVWDAALSSDGSRILSGSRDGTLRVWDARSGREVRQLEGAFVLGEHMAESRAVLMLPDGKTGVTAHGGDSYTSDYSIRLWDLDTGRELRRLRAPDLEK